MPHTAASFVGNIPDHYDSGLGPTIFTDYGDVITGICCAAYPSAVLELAAGTGIVSRKLRDRLPRGTSLTVTDLNAPMLDIARRKFGKGEAVDFVVADALDLPFGPETFDLMVCQFGVMFFPDKPASYHEAARVLAPGGHYVFNVWGAMADNPFSQIAQDVSASFFPEDPPGFYKVPFHYHDADQVLADLKAGGWRDVDHKTHRIDKTIADPDAFGDALVFGNPLVDEIRARGGVPPEEVATAMRAAIRAAFGPRDMVMPLSATTFVCRKP